MKTFYAFVLIAFLGLVIFGCSESTDQLVTPVEKMSTLNTGGSLEKQVLHSLTGSAHAYNILYDHPDLGLIILPGPKQKGSYYNVVTVNAIEHNDGTVTGHLLSQFQGKINEPSMFTDRVKMKVIQLVVDETGKKAKVVCEITEWNGPQLPWWFVMVFVDNGEGNTPEFRDHYSGWWFSDLAGDRDLWLSQTPQEYIDWLWAIIEPFNLPIIGPTLPLDNGNIQVR
jgi:hypothetical protein